MNDLLDLYQRMYDAFLKSTSLSKAEAQVAVIKIWNDTKRDFKDDKAGFEQCIVMKIQEYIDKANEISNDHYSMSYLTENQVKVEVVTQTDDEDSCPSTSTIHTSEMTNTLLKEEDLFCSSPGMVISGAHAQSKIANEIRAMQAELQSLYKKRSLHTFTIDDSKTISEKEEALRRKAKELKKLEQGQRRQMKYREKRKLEMSNLLENHPELKKDIPSLNEKRGRPRLKDDQPLLIKTIAEIAIHKSTYEDKRRRDSIRNINTLEKLTEELEKSGISVSQSGVYMRLTDKRNTMTEGKRHLKTVPVKCTNANNNNTTTHHDEKFCMATLDHLRELASLLGPNQVFLLSQNTRARINITLSAAHKDAPLLLQLEYRHTLPDEWVVQLQHKLVPTVYSGVVIQENCFHHSDAVKYSGPTYIAIRSGKHSPPTAFSQADDLKTVLDLPEFDKLGRMFEGGPAKPIFIMFVDGGPDESPRYEKVIQTAIHNFLEYNLDALFIATNAPGKSAFSHVEQRLSHLSRELNGVILPNETFGSHLDDNGKTVDDDLEIKNFQSAGQAITEIWSPIVLDGYSVSANYISPDNPEVSTGKPGFSCIMQKDVAWRSKHICEGQYVTQIVKCLDNACCTATRSDYFKIIPNRFLPPPLPLIQTTNGLVCPEFPNLNPEKQIYTFPSLFVSLSINGESMLPLAARSFKRVPYDLYCPTTQNQLLRRICKRCSLYHSSTIRLASHMKTVCNEKKVVPPVLRPLCLVARRQKEILALLTDNGDLEWVDEENAEWDLNMEDDILTSVSSSGITTAKEHISNPWENINP